MTHQRLPIFTELKNKSLSFFKIALVLTILFSIVQSRNFNLNVFLITLLLCFIYTFVIGFGNLLINNYLDKKWDWLTQTNLRVYYGILITLLFTIPAILAINYVVFILIQKNPNSYFFKESYLWMHIFYILLSLSVSTFMHARSFMLKWKQASKQEVKEQRMIAGTASAKFESLKSQIDPHFLFNSLNVLSSLIDENPDNAQKFTASLSKVYRYVLEQKDKELVTIQEEMAFAKTYMNLLNMRFENSLNYELIEEDSEQIGKVVPLSLQLLLENAVKHNIVSEQKPLFIKVFIEGEYLVIQNNLQKKEVIKERNGVGLQNIINRYEIVTHRKVFIEQNESIFKVKIPILTKQISIMEKQVNNPESNAYYRAKKRVEELKGFYANLISYCCVIPILIFINLSFSPQFHWFWFSAAGWGFGLTMHALKVFGYSDNWEERKIKEILEKEERNNWK